MLIASLLVVAAMVGFAFYMDATLPEGGMLPVHFNAAGQPDRYDKALTALLVAPVSLLVVSLIMAATPFLEPLQNKLEQSAPLLRAVWIGMIVVMIFVQVSIAAPALGWQLPPRMFYAVIGMFLIFLGNMLPKSRPSFFVGIRTPWTIMDTDNWIATHRLGGKLMMAAGAVIIINAFVETSEGVAIALLLGPILIAAFVPFVYSWWLWHQKKASGS
ncbi:SdpI family protein [Alteraurantiacibacter aestuarii]